ncbi:dTMP kinase [Candidatus Protochlamydia sp. W-9]|uniref:dTMP kinase n=1 Tax=Candidatus Protochlamydia sp. W-9 TaxID=1785087 RepID=UPI00096A389D|nr:dTMP kinase [Candidatus Protochlamydia sp. W-9]
MSSTKFKGYFITIEGGEGSGKSTLLNQLGDYFRNKGFEVIQTREPGGTKLGESIRHLLLNHEDSISIGHQAELLLFLAARAQHVEELIQPALKAGKIVLCDRFNDSTIAYQGAARSLDAKKIQNFCQLVCAEILPDWTLFLDVSPEIGLARTQKIQKDHAQMGQLDRIESEKIEFHERVRQAFLSLVQQEPQRIYRIDANESQSKVLQKALEFLEEQWPDSELKI